MPKIPKGYFEGRICCGCGSDKTYIKDTGSPLWRSCKCGKKNCTKYLCYDCFNFIERSNTRKIKGQSSKCVKCGRETLDDLFRHKYCGDRENWNGRSYLCHKCYCKEWYSNTIAYMRKCRIEEIDFSRLKELDERDKGRAIEDVVAEVLGLENQNSVSDDYNSPFDLTTHIKLGEIQVKARALDIDKRWKFEFKNISDYDTLCLVCLDHSWRVIERVLMIPTDELVKILDNILERDSVSIYKEKKFSEYNDFIVDYKPYDFLLQRHISESTKRRN